MFRVTNKEANWKHRWFNTVCSFFNDLFLFRTANFYFIYFYLLLLMYCLTQSISYFSLLAIIIAILLIWYIKTAYYHITSNCVIFHLDNKSISSQVLDYPYDWYFSMKHDIIMLGLKFLCSIEAIFFNNSSNSIEFLMFYFNSLIMIFVGLYFSYLIYHIVILRRLEWFIFNRLFVFLRIGLFLFICYTLLFYILFLCSSASNILISVILLMSLTWTILSIIILWKKIILTNLYNGKITLMKMLFVLFQTTRKTLFQIDINKLMTSFEYEYNLLFPKQVSQVNGNMNLSQNKLYYLFKLYAICKKRKSKSCMRKSINHIYCDIVKLLYYFTKGKTLKYFSYYNTIIRKYKGKDDIVINNTHFLITVYLSEFEDTGTVFTDIFYDANLHLMIKKTLISMQDLVQSSKELMKPIIFYNLSNEINELKSFARLMINKIELNETIVFKDQSIRNISQVNNYCLLIHRYLVETLTNDVLNKDSKMEIDILEDFLLFHYVNDRTLLLSTSLNNISLNEDITLGKVLKCGKEMIKYKGQSVTHIFPSQFRRSGVKLLSSKLSHYVNDDVMKINNHPLALTSDNTPFEFVINSFISPFVELFYYSFKIVPSIINNQMIINGMYTSNDKIIIIFKELPDGELVLNTFSPSVQKLLIINPDWVEFLHSNNIFITIDDLFCKCNKHINQDKPLEFECQFSCYKLANNLLTMPDSSELFNIFDKSNCSNLKEKITQARDIKCNTVNLKLIHLFTISERSNYLIFSIVTAKGLKSVNRSISNKQEYHYEDEDLLNIYQTAGTMNNSVNSSSISTSESVKKRKRLNHKNSKVVNISEQFAKFSNLILIFNCCMITVCIILLIVQIIQSQSLYKVNMLYYQFKTIQIYFSNTFLNIFSNICIAERYSISCTNAYQDYSRAIQKILNLNSSFGTRDYVVNSLQFKTDELQSLYRTYMINIHNFGDQTLLSILMTNMNYVIIRQGDNKLTCVVTKITLEEGLQNFINSLSILNKADGNFDAFQYYVHIISVNGLDVSLDNVLIKSLNEVQSEIYKIVINYVNYSFGYSYGEQKLLESFNKREKMIKTILDFFVGIVIIMHLILAILCRWIIVIVEKLLISIVLDIIGSIDQKEMNNYIDVKLDNLTTMNDLYIKNPNHLIKSVDKAKKEMKKKMLFRRAKDDKDSNHCNQLDDKHVISKEKQINLSDMDKVLFPLSLKIYGLFFAFFASVIVFDVFLLKSYSSVMIINNYVLANFGLEMQLYDNIALPQIMTLDNMTQEILAKGLGINNTDEDGILNMRRRQGNIYKNQIFSQEHDYPALLPPLSSYFDYNCSSIYKLINDTVTASVGKLLGSDFIYFQILMCDRFKVTSMNNFEYIYNDHNFRGQLLQDYLRTFSYDELFYFNTLFDFFDLFSFTILILRPLRAYINENILYKNIDAAFKQFILTISGYLCFNIIVDVLMFLIIKIVILGRINLIHSNFLGLRKCFTSND